MSGDSHHFTKGKGDPSLEIDPQGQQFAALPIRRDGDGTCRLLLITSKHTKQWIIPKGWAIPGLSPTETAAEEAYEESGVRGKMGKTPIGTYRYFKERRQLSPIPCEVIVYPLRVLSIDDEFPESESRTRGWFKLSKAVKKVGPEGLAMLLKQNRALIESYAENCATSRDILRRLSQPSVSG